MYVVFYKVQKWIEGIVNMGELFTHVQLFFCNSTPPHSLHHIYFWISLFSQEWSPSSYSAKFGKKKNRSNAPKDAASIADVQAVNSPSNELDETKDKEAAKKQVEYFSSVKLVSLLFSGVFKEIKIM